VTTWTVWQRGPRWSGLSSNRFLALAPQTEFDLLVATRGLLVLQQVLTYVVGSPEVAFSIGIRRSGLLHEAKEALPSRSLKIFRAPHSLQYVFHDRFLRYIGIGHCVADAIAE
jgi:hypothetical protein